MNISGMKKSRKKLLIVLSIAIITAGGIFMFSMLGKSQEERRNREYEVSLVETLKDSYEGIEEIRFSNANYTNPPGSWTCVVELFFNDRSIKYKINANISTRYKIAQNAKTPQKTIPHLFAFILIILTLIICFFSRFLVTLQEIS